MLETLATTPEHMKETYARKVIKRHTSQPLDVSGLIEKREEMIKQTPRPSEYEAGVLVWYKTAIEDLKSLQNLTQAQECEEPKQESWITKGGINDFVKFQPTEEEKKEAIRRLEHLFDTQPQGAEWVVEAILKEINDIRIDMKLENWYILKERIEKVLRKHLWGQKKEAERLIIQELTVERATRWWIWEMYD